MTSQPASQDRSRRGSRLRDLKSVPVLPSLITLGNLFLGFLVMAKIADAISLSDAQVMSDAVVSVFEIATLLIFLAMVFDALDGKVARATGQTSQFGAQLDSMADMVTFGVAPAFMAKVLINFHEGESGLLPAHPKLYYGAAAIYVLCAAMRLARYNVETGGSQSDHREFKGLPTPGAAVMLCAAVTFFCGWELRDGSMKISRLLLPEEMSAAIVVAMPATLVCLGLLMVSRVPYPHVFHAMVARRHSFPFLATLVVMLGLLAVEPQLALFALALSYVLFGIALGTYRLVTKGSMDPPDDPGEVVQAEDEIAAASRSPFAAEFTKDPKLN